MFVTEGSEEKCGKNSVKVTRCEITESGVDDGNRVCSLKCKCAESAESCPGPGLLCRGRPDLRIESYQLDISKSQVQ